MDLFGRQSPSPRANPSAELPITELKAELGLSSAATTKEVSAKFEDFLRRAGARFGALGRDWRSEAENSLAEQWHSLKSKLNTPEAGLLFGPSLTARTGNERQELHTLSAACDLLIPVSKERAGKLLKFQEAQRNGNLEIKEDEQLTWRACVTQLAREKRGEGGFLTQIESELLTKAENRLARHLGDTRIVWKEFDGRWEPAFEGSRYKNSSLLGLSVHYLNSCKANSRTPLSAPVQKEREAILDRVILFKEGKWDRRDLMDWLRQKYPPPTTPEC